MTKGNPTARHPKAVVICLLFSLVLSSLAAAAWLYALATERKSQARDAAFGQAQKIVLRIQEASGPAYMLGSQVIQNKGEVSRFEQAGEELLQAFPLAQAVELAPDGVVTYVHPLRGNENVVGHDLLKDKERNREAHLAVASRQLTVAGPFDLIQGGKGIVARYPVYLPNPGGRDQFWGFSIVLIRVPELLNAAGVMEMSREGYRYELCRVPPNANECAIFSRNSDEKLKDGVTVPVHVPNGLWQLSLAPEAGWVSNLEVLSALFMIFLITLLAGTTQRQFIKSLG